MDPENISKTKISIGFSPDEIAFLSNCINETLEAVENWEFETRTGETRIRATKLQTQLQELLERAGRAVD
jgi:hypothetical protein